MPVITENRNTLGLYVFSYHSYESDVEHDINHTTRSHKKIDFLLDAIKDRPIKYSYIPGKGLVKMNLVTGAVEDSNVLGELLSVPTNDTKKLSRFMNKYGSLFSNENISLDKYSQDKIFQIIDRLRWSVELMQLLCQPKITNHKTIMKLILCLFFSPDIEIQGYRKNTIYKRTNYFLEKLRKNMQGFAAQAFADQFNNEEFYDINNKITEIEIEDSVNGLTKIPFNDFLEELSDDKKYSNLFNQLAYMRYDCRKDVYVKLWDLLYYFFKEYPELITQTKNLNFEDFNKRNVKIDPKLNNIIENVGKGMLSTEINAHIKNVRPYHQMDKMEPNWQVNDLITALYLSLFYMKPKVEIIRKCANPNCNIYFIAPTSTSRTKFHDTSCARAVAQARYRKNKRLNSIEDE